MRQLFSDSVSELFMLGILGLPPPTKLRAEELLKHNIDALLKARGQTRTELAMWCRQSRSWADKWMTEQRRGVPAKYLDRIADFFGIATYQLFQPGISPLTERRSGAERRRLRDRRISAAMPVSQRPGDVDLMDIIRALSREGRERGIQMLGDILNDEIQHLRTTPAPPAGGGRSGGSDGSTHATNRAKRHGRKTKKSPKKKGAVPEADAQA